MTPAARYAAAIDLLDRIAAGEAAEKALTNWGRRSRFAGSKDRAAVRDHVFDALRMWRSVAALGGGDSGRARVLGLLRAQGLDPETIFTGEGHAPAPLSDSERAGGRIPEGAEAWDLPDWLAAAFSEDHGPEAASVAEALRHRAPVFVRVNTARISREAAQATLAAEGIEAVPHALADTALEVRSGARGLSRARAYLDGLVELQDAASQAVVAAIPSAGAAHVLDYCAGGGGKALALAARLPDAGIMAHDADPGRLADLPARARRAGARITLTSRPEGPYDLVLCDVPCSGSGAWRRAPEGKWRLTPRELERLTRTQDAILETCAGLVAEGGVLAYATCSVLVVENDARAARFASDHPRWDRIVTKKLRPTDGGDGFFLACFQRRS